MNLQIIAPLALPDNVVVTLPSSKSISNRALILDALSGFQSRIVNLSKANDTLILKRLLHQKKGILDAEDAGTVLRFATVYFSLIEGEHVITGTERLMSRPMQPLLQALKRLGGKSAMKKIDGIECLVIRGGSLSGGDVDVDASESSQFVSALLLCGASMPKGLVVTLKGKIVSEPYIDMTLGVMESFGLAFSVSKNRIAVPHQPVWPSRYTVESDWSSAAFFYAIASCYDSGTVTLKGLRNESLQGDTVIADLMEAFGVVTQSLENGAVLEKRKVKLPKSMTIDATHFPDLVPALMVAALCNGVAVTFKGVGHLRLKESNRIDAMMDTAKRLGASVSVTGKSGFTIKPTKQFPNNASFDSYNDHRMAMAVAPLATRCKSVELTNALVVKKSFLSYWAELKKLGYCIQISNDR